MNPNIELTEKYRPKSWTEVVGQDKAVKTVRFIGERYGYSGKCWWLSGQSGTGKSTIAKLIAAEVADPFSVVEVAAKKLTAEMLDEWDREMHLYGWGASGKSGRAYIINEAHGLSSYAMQVLDVMTEPPPSHVAFIFTTTVEGEAELFESKQDAVPFLSRCKRIALARRDLAEPFARLAMKVADAEGINGCDFTAYLRACKEARNNMRELLQRVAKGDFAQH